MFKIRASAAGKLMTKARKKDEVLSQTTKTYLDEYMKSELYGVQKQIKSKYLDKGNKNEDEAIDYLISNLDVPFAIKNEETFEDEYFKGTPDIIIDEVVYDTKCSWDCFSFPLFDTEITNKDYFAQLQVYMHLTVCKKAVLAYVLTNTPEELTWEEKHDYSNLDSKLRIKTFEIDYDEEFIKNLQQKVVDSRDYINEKLKF
jgi:hypothetical protein